MGKRNNISTQQRIKAALEWQAWMAARQPEIKKSVTGYVNKREK